MSTVEVRAVGSWLDRRRFLSLPWKLYEQDPYWIPPLRLNQKEMVNYKHHPFYDDADIRTFLAFVDGQPVGRIAAIINHAHNRRYPHEQRGFVGFFESVNDQAVADGLFDAATKWLRAEGLPIVRGPVNPSLNYECGLLVENFSMPPTFMMTYNPDFYPRLWEAYGFEKVQDLYTFVGHKEELATMEKKIFFVVQEATRRFGVKLRPLARATFKADVRSFLEIYNQSLENVWGHVPMSDKEIAHVSKGLRHLIIPELTMLAEVDGRIVGALFAMLDYNPRIKKIDGRLFPIGFLTLLRHREQITRVRLIATNVIPEYQRWGLGVVLAGHLLPPALSWGVEEGEFSWVLESNQLSRKSLERGNLTREKVHRIYDYLGPAA